MAKPDLEKILNGINREGEELVKVKIVQGLYGGSKYIGMEGKVAQYNTEHVSSKFGILLVIDDDKKLLWFMEEELEVIEDG